MDTNRYIIIIVCVVMWCETISWFKACLSANIYKSEGEGESEYYKWYLKVNII